VEITETYRKGWVAFFTSVCAVIGGVVSVMGMVSGVGLVVFSLLRDGVLLFLIQCQIA